MSITNKDQGFVPVSYQTEVSRTPDQLKDISRRLWFLKINEPQNVLKLTLVFSGMGLFLLALGTDSMSFNKFASAYPVDVLAILLALDLFSQFTVRTGILDKIGFKMALATRGNACVAAISMGALMFTASAALNNLAAIFMIAPVFLTLLRAMRATNSVVLLFLSMMLVLTNIGGFSSPIGDFPAILLLSSGLISFNDYLFGAFPLAASLAMISIFAYTFIISQAQRTTAESTERDARIALAMMRVRNENVRPSYLRAALLGLVFMGMICSWMLVPSDKFPFYMTALVGAVFAATVCGPSICAKVLKNYDLGTIAFMAIILTIAAVVSSSGMIEVLAEAIVTNTNSPRQLLIALMLLVTISAGLVSAGPATAAVLPMFVALKSGPLEMYGDSLGVAFAAAICAGSSMFLHSATSGPALRNEGHKAGFVHKSNLVWRDRTYLRFGVVTSIIQLTISILWIELMVQPQFQWLAAMIPCILMVLLAITTLSLVRRRSN